MLIIIFIERIPVIESVIQSSIVGDFESSLGYYHLVEDIDSTVSKIGLATPSVFATPTPTKRSPIRSYSTREEVPRILSVPLWLIYQPGHSY